jgi:hypothetical protein
VAGTPPSDTGSEAGGEHRCQARPASTRFGWREDVLCASRASTTVTWRGQEIPVCRMHEAAYARWGDDGERLAEERWGWSL